MEEYLYDEGLKEVQEDGSEKWGRDMYVMKIKGGNGQTIQGPLSPFKGALSIHVLFWSYILKGSF